MVGIIEIFQRSIRWKIVGIAAGLIIIMVAASALSFRTSASVHHLIEELQDKYIQSYGHLARVDIRSLERALALRRMIIAKMQVPPDEGGYSAQLKIFNEKNGEVEREAKAARELINSIIDDTTTPSDNASLARIETRMEDANSALRSRLNDETSELISLLDAGRLDEATKRIPKIDDLRDELTQTIETIRSEMLTQLDASAGEILREQRQTILIAGLVTLLAALIGFSLAVIVSGGITRPVRNLLSSTLKVEAGQLDGSVAVTTRDEIGQLARSFNNMVEQLRRNARVRETFGRYIDPKIVEGLLDGPSSAEAKGQRRVMTVLFCDMKGFTTLSEGMTPQGLVKVMNRYLTMMSEPIRAHRGIIDKYIGDAIMAYWGPPFVEESEQANLACRAAIEMMSRVETLRAELPEILGVRKVPMKLDIRVGIATGEALVGSIGSDLMMSYTVMGDTVNLASRLEGTNNVYRTHSLVSASTMELAGTAIVGREIDSITVVGQTRVQPIFEIIGLQGELTPEQQQLLSKYSEGLTAYRLQQWDQAKAGFAEVLATNPHDGPARVMLDRIELVSKDGPPTDWDGTWHFDRK
jgi:class 3 adenylate cyclase